MLVDIHFKPLHYDIIKVASQVPNHLSEQDRHPSTGIYFTTWWNPEFDVEEELLKYPFEWQSFGVCDNYQQILDAFPDILSSHEKYVIFLVCLRKEDQPPTGGWRWHKWGQYIGTQEPKMEYLYDEPIIELVYTFHIYQISP